MAGLLGDIYSAGDTLKRRLRGLLADPVGTIGLGVERFGEDQRGLLNLRSNAYPMAGERTVLNSPDQIKQFRAELADKATEHAMAGMFVGAGSKTWDALGAAKAQQLMDAGTDARKIWSETGTWRGPDGAWRQEIPDNAADVPRYRKQIMRPFDEAMLHEPLEEAYPSVKNIIIETSPGGALSGAEYRQNVKFHKYGDRESIVLRNSEESAKQNKSLAMHELQHAIQQREGWARGGSPEMFADTMPYESLVKRSSSQQDAYIRAKAAGGVDPETGLSLGGLKQSIDDLSGQIQSWKSPHDQYMRLAGEAEARATQARIPLDAAQRRALYPEDSYDVPIGQLIMRGIGR